MFSIKECLKNTSNISYNKGRFKDLKEVKSEIKAQYIIKLKINLQKKENYQNKNKESKLNL